MLSNIKTTKTNNNYKKLKKQCFSFREVIFCAIDKKWYLMYNNNADASYILKNINKYYRDR